MIKKTLTTIAFAAGCAMALAAPVAQAQTMNSQTQINPERLGTGDHDNWVTDRNHTVTGQYHPLPNTGSAYREWRIRKECAHLTVAHLRTGCVDTVNIEEDQRARSMESQRARTLNDGLTGGGHGRMNPIDRTFQGPEEYDPHFGR